MTSALLQQIVRGLDGVTAGPWKVKPDREKPDYVHHVVGPSEIVVGLDGICSPHRMNDRTFAEDKANMAHIARCDPDTMREIAAYVRDLEERLAKAAEALEPFAKEAAELAAGVTDDCVYALPRFPDLGLSYFDVGDLRRARTALTTIRRNDP